MRSGAVAAVSYALQWEHGLVTLPAVLVRGAENAGSGFISEPHIVAPLVTKSSRRTRLGMEIGVCLIPRPDNDYNEWAVSIAAPADGRTVQERHAGYLYDDFLGRHGQQAPHRLARYSGGEIHCTAYVQGDGSLGALALPKPSALLAAIDVFLTAPSTPALATRPTLTDLTGLRPYGQVMTDDSLRHLSGFSDGAHPVGHIALDTQRNNRGRPRSLRLRDELTGRHLGEVALGILFLEDERDRPAVLARLAEVGVPVAQPTSLALEAGPSTGWWHDQVPNMWTYWRVEGLDFRPRDPHRPRSLTWVAQYNPTSRVLFVEDEPLVMPSCIYAARLGLEVLDVKVPEQRWQLEREFRYRERCDPDLRPEERLETVVKPRIWMSLRHKLPEGTP